jgi:hypothetical protein
MKAFITSALLVLPLLASTCSPAAAQYYGCPPPIGGPIGAILDSVFGRPPCYGPPAYYAPPPVQPPRSDIGGPYTREREDRGNAAIVPTSMRGRWCTIRDKATEADVWRLKRCSQSKPDLVMSLNRMDDGTSDCEVVAVIKHDDLYVLTTECPRGGTSSVYAWTHGNELRFRDVPEQQKQ